MITITDKHRCCGCEACVQRCPKQCILFVEDNEGFLYPKPDVSVCIECGLCEKVCPVLNQGEPKHPLNAYAAINQDDDIRAMSSSGGIFTSMAEKIIEDGGIVFGARFNDKWEVEHHYTETHEGLQEFRKSKYVQSRIGETYILAENFLKQGRKVLFSGTSCQIAGLNYFLRKPYDNLLTVDVVCHGVASPKIWREYLHTVSPVEDIHQISMKDKAISWRGYKLTITGKNNSISEKVSQNKYMLSYSQNLSLRPSCYQCPAKAGKSYSDVTLADYWGVEKLIPEMNDDRGTSFVCANTSKGEFFLKSLSVKMMKADYASSVPFNACIERSTIEPAARTAFWESYQNNGIAVLQSLKPIRANIFKRIIRRIIK